MPTRGKQDGAPPADRLLDSAAELFDSEGIRAVGIDRLISEADVARASLYQHFGSKDALVVAYLERTDRRDRAAYAHAVRELGGRPLGRIRAVFTSAATSAERRNYRGCLYVNALTEFPDDDHPVRRVVLDHRQWLVDELVAALEQIGVPDPRALAARIQLIYDGALVGSKAVRDASPITNAAALVDEMVLSASPAP
ncbi:TetR/AcrR family transcriptional regulator [Pseudonocardia endophytica]|uniref:TetR family transcriptional regulator n=1 Tax=Pseudonocardia endophytica TaxID=401976 RepID=A0A4R1HJL2_PSEEN|nr:TetR/AcrR family transcriptional regulator [Pseudonocardia endophytica]TCK22048.1 TetR family transcriptional regulator [Pseudonocardia endophytica]